MTKNEIYNLFFIVCDGVFVLEPISDCNTYQMGLIKLDYNEKENILTVYVRRPGLLIGKAGLNYSKIKEYLECDIHIEEVKEIDMGVY